MARAGAAAGRAPRCTPWAVQGSPSRCCAAPQAAQKPSLTCVQPLPACQQLHSEAWNSFGLLLIRCLLPKPQWDCGSPLQLTCLLPAAQAGRCHLFWVQRVHDGCRAGPVLPCRGARVPGGQRGETLCPACWHASRSEARLDPAPPTRVPISIARVDSSWDVGSSKAGYGWLWSLRCAHASAAHDKALPCLQLGAGLSPAAAVLGCTGHDHPVRADQALPLLLCRRSRCACSGQAAGHAAHEHHQGQAQGAGGRPDRARRQPGPHRRVVQGTPSASMPRPSPGAVAAGPGTAAADCTLSWASAAALCAHAAPCSMGRAAAAGAACAVPGSAADIVIVHAPAATACVQPRKKIKQTTGPVWGHG